MSDINLVIRYENGNLKIISKEAEDELKKAGKKSGKEFSDEFSGEVKKSNPFKGVESSFNNLKSSLLSFKGLAIFGVAAFNIKSITQAAIEQENAVNRLNAALKISGSFSLEASQRFQALASELQSLTKFGDEEILNQIALAKSFGATNAQAAEIARVAVDLAEAFDIDLTSATRNAAKTLGGFAGELGEVIPELKDLTKEQLRAGEGVKLLGDRFGGTASERVQTFSGAAAQATNAWGDLLEGFGQFITDNPLVLAGLQNTTNFVSTLAEAVKFTAKQLNIAFGAKEAVPDLQRLDAEISEVIDRADKLRNILKLADARGGRTTQEEIFARELEQLDKLEKGLLRRRKTLVDAAAKSGEEEKRVDFRTQAEILAERDKVTAQLGVIGLDRIQQLALQEEQQLEVLNKAKELNIVSLQEFNDRKLFIEQQFTEQIKAEQDKRTLDAQVSAENIAKAFQVLGANYKVTAGDISKTLLDLSVRGFGRAFQNIGAAIASGKNVNQAFVDSVKQTASEAASAFGDYYIKLGVARLAASYGTEGYTTLAAGAGLKLLAGALGSAGAGASSVGVGGGATSAGSTSFIEPNNVDNGFVDNIEPTSAQPQTVLNINVEGNIVDNETFVRNLVQEIGEEGGKQGLVFNNFATV